MPGIYVLVEHDRGEISPATFEALTAARNLAQRLTEEVVAVFIGVFDSDFNAVCTEYGISEGVVLASPLITDYGPELWGEALSQLSQERTPSIVMSVGTDKGNEVIAHASARLGSPFIANCIEVHRDSDWTITRMQWGGSLLEDVRVDTEQIFLSYAHHSVEPETAALSSDANIQIIELELDSSLTRTLVQERAAQAEGATLSTASVVVSGGRGVGSADAFAPLEELADLLAGKVGCSRAVTNNGWRSHADQVGQTGTRIAPEIYIACGISGAIQHWVGAMASKNILAINIDPEANMVTKAGYAVLGDLHEVVPAIIEEIKRRR
ncbi:MAG TPA: electron transfer flavoprotein subunit alpha/FixB family protein [Acidimicrobiales bacterium]|nr:electron transfer flavoprotein subunit alpha/FixB family protein [Acidimicrobiales bacterium]